LLWLEELQTSIDIRQYDTTCQVTKNDGPAYRHLYIIKVQSLAEKRPSVLVGDHIIATYESINNYNDEKKFIGYVWFVNLDHILVDFGRNFDISKT